MLWNIKPGQADMIVLFCSDIVWLVKGWKSTENDNYFGLELNIASFWCIF